MVAEDAAFETIPTILTDAFPPESEGLLVACAAMMTDDLLAEISRADYGMDETTHFEDLRVIREYGVRPGRMAGGTQEVLELTRWSQPDEPTPQHRFSAMQGHIMRAFSCAALLRAGGDPANHDYLCGENQSLVTLIDSATTIASGLPEAAARFLTWRIPRLVNDEERPLFAFGLVALAILYAPRLWSSAEVDEMTQFIERAEADVRDPMGVCTTDMLGDASLLDLTRFGQRHNVWQQLATRLLSADGVTRRLAALLRRIADDDH